LIASLVERYGEEAIRETWATVHGYPVEWATDPREVFEVAKHFNTKGI